MSLSPEILARLYTAAPDDFLSLRKQLSDSAKQSSDTDGARQIAALRKPTLGAWIVNRQVHAEPSCVEQLVDLGARLRAAHEQLDATVMRELSTERRQLVAELTTAALTRADRPDPPAALRDDVTGTFDAAVADPQIAARLGRLTRPEQWSGFGIAMDTSAGTPELTVIRGGRDRPKAPARGPAQRAAPAVDAAVDHAVDPAARRQARRARDKAEKARAALTQADAALEGSEAAERSVRTHVQDLSAEVARLQAELDKAKRDLERSRRAVKSARSRRREARSALDRSERQLEQDTT